MENYNEAVAILVARIFLGVLFIIQGYDKIFVLKLENVASNFKFEMKLHGFPDSGYKFIAFVSSFIELIGGIFLLTGFLKYYALSALGADLIIVAVGMSLIKPVWNMDLVFPRLALLLFILITPGSWDLFSLDHFLSTLSN
jgi:putative oxidoreductase